MTEHVYDDVSEMDTDTLVKELYFARASVDPGDDLTEGWLTHLEAEVDRRARDERDN